ncbi:MAG: hypothetical protein JOZ15_13585 [Acidobacteria bacterium]|nr:hypothetical protein [Acidobacteriota bacterium]
MSELAALILAESHQDARQQHLELVEESVAARKRRATGFFIALPGGLTTAIDFRYASGDRDRSAKGISRSAVLRLLELGGAKVA